MRFSNVLMILIKISLSRGKITRRIEELSHNIKSVLKETCARYLCYSLALKESTDQTDIDKLASFVRKIDHNFDAFEKLLLIVSIKDNTIDEDILKTLTKAIEFNYLVFKNLAGVATDKAPSVIGSHTV